jgi:hypothetical protein
VGARFPDERTTHRNHERHDERRTTQRRTTGF